MRRMPAPTALRDAARAPVGVAALGQPEPDRAGRRPSGPAWSGRRPRRGAARPTPGSATPCSSPTSARTASTRRLTHGVPSGSAPVEPGQPQRGALDRDGGVALGQVDDGRPACAPASGPGGRGGSRSSLPRRGSRWWSCGVLAGLVRCDGAAGGDGAQQRGRAVGPRSGRPSAGGRRRALPDGEVAGAPGASSPRSSCRPRPRRGCGRRTRPHGQPLRRVVVPGRGAHGRPRVERRHRGVASRAPAVTPASARSRERVRDPPRAPAEPRGVHAGGRRPTGASNTGCTLATTPSLRQGGHARRLDGISTCSRRCRPRADRGRRRSAPRRSAKPATTASSARVADARGSRPAAGLGAGDDVVARPGRPRRRRGRSVPGRRRRTASAQRGRARPEARRRRTGRRPRPRTPSARAVSTAPAARPSSRRPRAGRSRRRQREHGSTRRPRRTDVRCRRSSWNARDARAAARRRSAAARATSAVVGADQRARARLATRVVGVALDPAVGRPAVEPVDARAPRREQRRWRPPRSARRRAPGRSGDRRAARVELVAGGRPRARATPVSSQPCPTSTPSPGLGRGVRGQVVERLRGQAAAPERSRPVSAKPVSHGVHVRVDERRGDQAPRRGRPRSAAASPAPRAAPTSAIVVADDGDAVVARPARRLPRPPHARVAVRGQVVRGAAVVAQSRRSNSRRTPRCRAAGAARARRGRARSRCRPAWSRRPRAPRRRAPRRRTRWPSRRRSTVPPSAVARIAPPSQPGTSTQTTVTSAGPPARTRRRRAARPGRGRRRRPPRRRGRPPREAARPRPRCGTTPTVRAAPASPAAARRQRAGLAGRRRSRRPRARRRYSRTTRAVSAGAPQTSITASASVGGQVVGEHRRRCERPNRIGVPVARAPARRGRPSAARPSLDRPAGSA